MLRPKSYGTTSYPGLGFSVTWALHGAENPEADRHSWRVESGTGRAFGLKQSSYQLEGWQHLMLEGVKAFIAPGRIWRWTWWTLRAVSLQEHRAYGSSPWFEQGNRATGVLKPHIFTIIIYKMAIGTNSHYYSLFVLAKWSIVKCRTTRWLLVNLCCFPCKDEGDLFWRCLQFPPYPSSMPSNPKRCMSLRGILMNSGDMVWHHFATLETRLWHVVAN